VAPVVAPVTQQPVLFAAAGVRAGTPGAGQCGAGGLDRCAGAVRVSRDSIDVHLSFVFAAVAVRRSIEASIGWSIKKFVTTARRYRTIQIQAGDRTITATDPLPDDLHNALEAIRGTH
jgi:hypothetical protein